MNNNNNYYLLTGGTSGIGESLMYLLLNDKNCNILVTGRDENKLIDLYNKNPDRILYFVVDFELINSVEDLVSFIVKEEITIMGFVHSAGLEITKSLSSFTEEDILKIFKINTFVPISIIGQLTKKRVFNSEDASIVLLSSSSVVEGSLGKSVYASTKGALEGFLLSAVKELIVKNIRINIVRPAIIDTPMTQKLLKKLSTEQFLNLKNTYPMDFGKSSDVANLILFLLKNESRWINGSIIDINGAHLANK
jgi:NAD(P)-dependent dehydrogenase (short-subunit alcohol dehydrogenase family)